MVNETSQAPVVIYDTMTGTKRPVELLVPGEAGVYCCGPTVYDMSHIGHARAAVMPDLLVRYLRYRGVKVRFVKNFTDVDDKIIARAAEQGVSPREISERYLEAYCEDMARLNVVAPDVATSAATCAPRSWARCWCTRATCTTCWRARGASAMSSTMHAGVGRPRTSWPTASAARTARRWALQRH